MFVVYRRENRLVVNYARYQHVESSKWRGTLNVLAAMRAVKMCVSFTTSAATLLASL